MEFKAHTTEWVAQLFDPGQPYLYAVILPFLALFALGFRTQALMYIVGAVSFLLFIGVS